MRPRSPISALALAAALLVPSAAPALEALDRGTPAAVALLRADPSRSGFVPRPAAEASFAAAAAEGEARARATWASLAAICDVPPSTPQIHPHDVDEGIGRVLLRADADGDGVVGPGEARAYLAARPDPASRAAATLALSMAEHGVGMPVNRLSWASYAIAREEVDEGPITLADLLRGNAEAWRRNAAWLDAAFREGADSRGLLRLDATIR